MIKRKLKKREEEKKMVGLLDTEMSSGSEKKILMRTSGQIRLDLDIVDFLKNHVSC